MADQLDARAGAVPTVFDVDDFDRVTAMVIDTWTAGADRDWSVPAGTLQWSCLTTADHTIDCVFSYALFLASGKLDEYPRFGELHALPEAGPADMVEGLRAVATMLSSVIRCAEPGARAVIRMRPQVTTGAAIEFAARGGLELILHGYDIACGLDVAFEPPFELCQRLLDSTGGLIDTPTEASIGNDPWTAVLVRSGRRPEAG